MVILAISSVIRKAAGRGRNATATYVIDQLLPVLDEFDAVSFGVLVVGGSKDGAGAPQIQLSQRLANLHFSLGALVQLLRHKVTI